LLGELLGHLAAARAQQSRRPRGCGIGGTGGQDGSVEPIERITHGGSEYRQPAASGVTNRGSLVLAGEQRGIAARSGGVGGHHPLRRQTPEGNEAAPPPPP